MATWNATPSASTRFAKQEDVWEELMLNYCSATEPNPTERFACTRRHYSMTRFEVSFLNTDEFKKGGFDFLMNIWSTAFGERPSKWPH